MRALKRKDFRCKCPEEFVRAHVVAWAGAAQILRATGVIEECASVGSGINLD
jgi:hypothetical protein